MAGDPVLGSFSKLACCQHSRIRHRLLLLLLLHQTSHIPLNARQDCGNVVGRAPSVLQDVEAELARSVDIGVEHLTNEFDLRRFVGVLLFELHHQSESPVLEGCVGRSNYDGVPNVRMSIESWSSNGGAASAACGGRRTMS